MVQYPAARYLAGHGGPWIGPNLAPASRNWCGPFLLGSSIWKSELPCKPKRPVSLPLPPHVLPSIQLSGTCRASLVFLTCWRPSWSASALAGFSPRLASSGTFLARPGLALACMYMRLVVRGSDTTHHASPAPVRCPPCVDALSGAMGNWLSTDLGNVPP